MIGWRFSSNGTTLDLSNLTTGILDGTTSGSGGTTTVTDSYHFMLLGSRSTVQGTIASIQGYLNQAKDRKNDKPYLPRVFIERNLGDGTWWRSEVINGEIILDDESLDRIGRTNAVPITISIERMNWWEGAEVEIPLTNVYGSSVVGGIGVNNPDYCYKASTISFDSATKQIRDNTGAGLAKYLTGTNIWVMGSASNDSGYFITDGGHATYATVSQSLVTEAAGASITLLGAANNYVEIAAANAAGDLPSPVRIEMTNAYNNATNLSRLWMAHMADVGTAPIPHILQGEDASYGGTTSTAQYSHRQYQNFTWTGDAQNLIGRWVLSTAFLNLAASRWFKILAVMSTAPAQGTKVQCKITYPSGSPLTVVGSSAEVTLDGLINDIGTFQLPPWGVGSGDLAPVDLCLYARKTGGGSLGIDYFQITPLDGYRFLTNKGYGLAYNARLADDGIEGLLWTDGWATPGKTGHYVGLGERILLKPGKTQRIYILQSGETGDASLYRKLTVRVYSRPRRGTL